MKNFYFGSASSAFQVEGAANLDNRTDSIWDEYTKRNYYIPEEGSIEREINHINISADFYNNYKEDIKLMKEMGLKMYRFSISWSRIYPKNNRDFNLKGIEFYHNVIDELLKNDIEPLVTLFHWDTPIWVQCRNGFLNREVVESFNTFAKTCFKEYGKKVKYWLTFNEMIIQNLQQYVWGKLTPEYINRSDYAFQAMHYSHLSCAKAVESFKNLRSQGLVREDSLVGITHTEGPLYYAFDENSSDDREATKIAELICNKAYFDVSFKGEYPKEFLNLLEKNNINIDLSIEDEKLLKENTHELIGWNYYQPHYVSKSKTFNKDNNIFGWYKENIPSGVKTTKWKWIIEPEKMIQGLQRLEKEYPNMPLIITENGFGDFDKEENGKIYDYERIDYLRDHLKGCFDAVETNNINLIGYCYWSFQDIYSPSAGYRKRYGLVKVDFETQERSKKLSYYYYKKVIENNTYNIDLNLLEKEFKKC